MRITFQKQNIGDGQNAQILCKRQTLFIVVGTYYIAIYYENKQLRILKKICKNLGSN